MIINAMLEITSADSIEASNICNKERAWRGGLSSLCSD